MYKRYSSDIESHLSHKVHGHSIANFLFSGRFERGDEEKCFTDKNVRACDDGTWSRGIYSDKNQLFKRLITS